MNPETSQPESPHRAPTGTIRCSRRTDLQISRQIYQGDPVYVVQDRVTFRTHRLTALQYRVLVELDRRRTLDEHFQRLTSKDLLSDAEKPLFHQLISSFAQLNLLVIPETAGQQLYRSWEQRQRMMKQQTILSFLFLKIPLVNPDAFLQRTMHHVSWIFSRAFLIVWMLAMATAIGLIAVQLDQFMEPLNGLLASGSIPFLWATFIALKVWHELGHGYACRLFGGPVPEMGTILIAGTPAAYVDASSAWTFPERARRLAVMCGGMFFESLVFIASVFLWTASDNPVIRSCAWQLIVLTSVVTILFNANPLMKFDGYFILSELVGIQNLRSQADAAIRGCLKRFPLGLTDQADGMEPHSAPRRTALILYGVCAAVYRFTLIISIAAMVAVRFPVAGLLLAVFHITTTAGLGSLRLIRWLLQSPETAGARGRAQACAATVFVGVPAAACLLPVPFGVVAPATVAAESESYLNVSAAGELVNILVTPGQRVEAGSVIARLSNHHTVSQLRLAQAELQEAVVLHNVAAMQDPLQAAGLQTSITERRQQLRQFQQRADELSIAASGCGVVATVLSPDDRGRFLAEGNPVAVIVDGQPLLRAWLNEDQLGSVDTTPGTRVSIRIPGRSTSTWSGRIHSIQPAAAEQTVRPQVTQAVGGPVLLNPVTGEPTSPVFQIDVRPEETAVSLAEHGTRASLYLPRRRESLAAWAARRCLRFVRKLMVV